MPDLTRRDIARILATVSLKRGGRLAGLDLRGIDFSWMDLSHFTFRGSDLRGAKFCRTILSGVEFNDANMEGADLQGAVMEMDGPIGFVHANLRRANLRGAGFTDVNFECCDLRRADFTGARLHDVCFWGAQLAGAKLLDVTAYDVRFDEGYLDVAVVRGGKWEEIRSVDRRKEVTL